MARPGFIGADETKVFVRELDREYPLIVRAKGVWLHDSAGNSYLDGIGGGAMVSSLGYGVPEIVEAAAEQARAVSFLYNQQFTSLAQEELAERLIAVAPEGFARVHFVSGGSEANEMGVRLARAYHVERGDPDRWRVISPAQAYHGPTAVTLALTGRPHLQRPFDPYLVPQPHVPPSTWRFDPTGEVALAALDRIVDEHGAGSISAFFCEPVSAAALPAYSPPERFWEGLAERRDEHGFLVVFDEVVTGIGRTGTWFAADQLPVEPDIITTAKGLGAGYAAIGGTLCREHVYEAIERGSRGFEHGHTWDGAPLPSAVGVAVLRYIEEHDLVERVRSVGPALRERLEDALSGCEMVREVRGRGYLLGVEYVDPRDGESFLPSELGVARRIDQKALGLGLTVYSTQPTADGYTGDQSLLAPAFVMTDDELDQLILRMAAAVRAIEREVKDELPAPSEPATTRAT
jgi:adenosylmethionine-8-amino-7-oxononanoate aminotransferase